MSKIKVLYITQSFGGVFTYIRQIIERIDFNQFDLAVIAPPDEAFHIFCDNFHIEYYPVKMYRGFKPFFDIKNINDFKRAIRKIDPDLVHLHSSKAGFIGRIACHQLKKKSIFTPHGLSYLSFKGNKRSVFFSMENYAKQFTYRILGCSYSEAAKMQFELGIPAWKIDALPNALSIPPYLAAKESFNKKSPSIHIGVIARLTYQKNPLQFVEVAKRITDKYPDTHFSILGAGLQDHLKEETENLVKEYGLNNRFSIYNWGDADTSRHYLESLDIFLMTSIFEGLPFSLIEAMSKGILCITSKCDGCNDVVQNNVNGFACMTTDEYVDAIGRFIEQPELQQKIRQQAFEYVAEKHNIDHFIKSLESYYRKLHEEPYKEK